MNKERFEKIRKLGEGTYGTVYLVRDGNRGLVAVKKIKL